MLGERWRHEMIALVLLTVLCACSSKALNGVIPRTCAPGSVAAGEKFCNVSLSLEDRADALVEVLSDDELLGWFNIASPSSNPYIERLNIKNLIWDSTCIQGLAPVKFPRAAHISTTVYPSAIAQGATWDAELIYAMGRSIAAESRDANRYLYQKTNGKSYGGIICDGGPLANLAQDPRWGRISETYGEDEHLVATLGSAAILGLQNMQCQQPKKCFYETLQVTRHLLGYHGARPDLKNGGEEVLYDQEYLERVLLAPYRAFHAKAGALGLMCALSTINGIPSCSNRKLLDYVTSDTNTTFIQTDCCDSITAMVNQHHAFHSLEDALVASVDAGVTVSYGYHEEDLNEAWASAIASGKLAKESLKAAARTVALARLRLGEFEPVEPSFRDSFHAYASSHTERRKLAKTIAQRSFVLMQNKENSVLPIRFPSDGKVSVLLVGPFVNCTCHDEATYAGEDCFLHSYHGKPSIGKVPTLAEVFEADERFTVSVEPLCTTPLHCEASPQTFDRLQNRLETTDYVILGLGLGASVERESVDREYLELPVAQRKLLDFVLDVSTKSKRTKSILAMHSAGGVTLEPKDLSRVDAMLQVWYGGQEHASALKAVLCYDDGAQPMGRLPLTVYQPGYLGRLNTSIVNLDARVSQGRTTRFLKEEPQFPFGFGLSYFQETWRVEFGELRVNVLSRSVSCALHWTIQNALRFPGSVETLMQLYLDGVLQSFRWIKFGEPYLELELSAWPIRKQQLVHVVMDGQMKSSGATQIFLPDNLNVLRES